MHGRLVAALLALPLVGGCAAGEYYASALAGQWQLLAGKRPVQALIDAPDTEPALRARLRRVLALREFATRELALPDNGSYRSYVDLGRPYAVWNVFAAPALSLEPRRWCFPVVGCLSYRGHFSAAAAEQEAQRLRAGGDDVYVAGIPAYSTLGWFDDPLLNTFAHWPVGRLAELLLHELAHQRVYIDDDSSFNESFATAVGRAGAERWLARQASDEERAAYREDRARQRDFVALTLAARADLEAIYASGGDTAELAAAKAARLQRLREDYAALRTAWGGYAGYDRWFEEDLNNAKLAAVGTYQHWAPAFAALLEAHGGDFAAFYAAVEELGRLPRAEREAGLAALAGG